MFDHISKHLEVCQKYSATRRIFNSLLGVNLSIWSSTVFRFWYIIAVNNKIVLLAPKVGQK